MQGTLKINTEKLLPIIKKWLYSDKDIFLRELISNSCDALKKIEILRDQGALTAPVDDLKIEITLDAEKRVLTISDTGIGMSADEVEKYIAQIAFSGAEEFLSKYKTEDEKDQIIGHFGLGFYSAYMVASKVTIDTLSYQEGAAAALWSCDGSSSYDLELGSRSTRGTTITLFIDSENDEFLDSSRIQGILAHYCSFLPYPIFLNGTQINEKEPLYLKNSSSCTPEEYVDFYHTLYPLDADPIFWIHLNIDYPFHLKGILYFPKISRRFDWSQSSLKLFCNRVFVSDSCKEVMPDYLMCLKGAIDSTDIPLNVSRSTLQLDKTVRQLSSHISKKVADRLVSLYQNEREKFIAAWPDIEVIIKLGTLQDEKFYERVKECLIWKNLKGSWMILEEYLALHPDKVFYTSDPHSPLLPLYQNKEVLITSTPVDTTLMNFLESKHKITFQRVDGAIDSTLVDTSREKTVLDAEGKTESARIASFFRSHLPCDVEAKSLSSDQLPAILVVDEGMRRMREYMSLTQADLKNSFPDKKTFVVNTNSKIVSEIYALSEKKPELAKELAHHLYELSLLSQKEIDPQTFHDFAARSSKILEELLTSR